MFVFQFSKRDMHYFKAAQTAASQSDFKVQVGCVAVYKGSVIATGCSQEKTSPVMAKYNYHRHFLDHNFVSHKLHAEISALCKIKYLDIDFSKVILYIWRGKYTPQISRPCPACMAMVRKMGIKHVYYSGDGSLVYEKIVS